MQWLNRVVDEVEKAHPDGEILIESGVSPSGTYHVGTLREVLTCDAVLLELKRRGRAAKHVHYVDDLDVFRKVPVNVPPAWQEHLGKPLCDVPAPSGQGSYADYFLDDFLGAAQKLHMDMEVIRSHQKYRGGAMTQQIETALANVDKIRQIIEEVSGRKLEKDWAPIQVLEDGYLKNRRFVSIDKAAKTVTYLDADDKEQTKSYAGGDVKLSWRVDWPARWQQLGVNVEPFGRDHATKGGSYDTGAAIVKEVFAASAPYPVPYNFINLAGETKKMSKSSGQIVGISELTEVLPPEVVRFFTLRYSPDKLLFFDESEGVTKLIDDYAALLASGEDKQLVEICSVGQDSVVSSVPFSHLVSAYQASLKDPQKTLEVIERTEHNQAVKQQAETIKKELAFIDNWLNKWAPEEVKFELAKQPPANLTAEQRAFLAELAAKIAGAPAAADGEWFHKAVYNIKESHQLQPQDVFKPLYQTLIGQDSGPRAGWFLSILPRDWLTKRLRLES